MGRKKDKKKKKALPSTFGILGSGEVADREDRGAKDALTSFFSPTAERTAKGDQHSGVKKTKIKTSKKTKGDTAFATDEAAQLEIHGDWGEMLHTVENWLPLPFSHGMEMELIICDDQGNYLEGDEMVYRMEAITKEAARILNQVIKGERQDFVPIPEYIRGKIKKMAYNDRDIEKGLTMKLAYDLDGQEITVDAFGRDGNVTAVTYILELVTPPCQYAEELAYWASFLFNLATKVMPKDFHIVSSAFNPASKAYNRGLSQGDHHHIGGFTSDQERAQAYSMIRNFLPHIIGLSVNSPIINNKPTDVIKIRKGMYTCPSCIRSLRLFNNTTMLSSNEARFFLPYLSTGDENDKQLLLETLAKASMEDARFQDVFPFTDWGTMEVRVMDAQLSICRRIGLGLLVQALCYKARQLNSKGKWVPNVNSDTLVLNRKGAMQRGLISVFKPVNLTKEDLDQYGDPLFTECYLGPPNRPNRYLFQATQQMFRYIKDALKELGYLYSPFMKPLLQSVFGQIDYAKPPITEAEYQLSVYHVQEQDGYEPDVLAALIHFTQEYSKDPIANPLIGELTLPDYMLD